MVSRSIRRALAFSSAIATAALFSSGVSAYQVSVDQLTIYKNGNLYINDTFSDGAPPPGSGSNFGSGTTPATYFTLGNWTETGGRAIADSSNGPHTSTNPFDPSEATQLHTARLNSSSGTNTAIGLRNDDVFYAMALYDLSSILDQNDSSYNLRFRDSGSGNPTNDDARIGVRRTDSGNMIVRFGDFDQQAGTFNILDTDLLQSGHDQILLRLDHDGTGSVTGSYAYVSGGLDLANAAAVAGQSFFNLSGSATLFNGENWTRTELAVFETVSVPEPGMAVLIVAGFAGMILHRRRRSI